MEKNVKTFKIKSSKSIQFWSNSPSQRGITLAGGLMKFLMMCQNRKDFKGEYTQEFSGKNCKKLNKGSHPLQKFSPMERRPEATPINNPGTALVK